MNTLATTLSLDNCNLVRKTPRDVFQRSLDQFNSMIRDILSASVDHQADGETLTVPFSSREPNDGDSTPIPTATLDTASVTDPSTDDVRIDSVVAAAGQEPALHLVLSTAVLTFLENDQAFSLSVTPARGKKAATYDLSFSHKKRKQTYSGDEKGLIEKLTKLGILKLT